jgi:hypothetical protein
MPTFCPQTAGPSPSRRDRSQPRRRVWLLLLLAACCIGLQYAATLASWFGVSASQLSTIFPNLAGFSSQNLGFV